jgi:hypothetical protein
MEYNGGVKSRLGLTDAVRLVRFASMLWIGYLAVLALINLAPWEPPRIPFETPIKHAQAKTLAVRIEVTAGKTILTVRDDGTGFEEDKVSKSGRFGLTGMRERALLAGGELSITSKPGEGTTVRLIV